MGPCTCAACHVQACGELPPAALGGKMPTAHLKALRASWLAGKAMLAQQERADHAAQLAALRASLEGKGPSEQALIQAQMAELASKAPADAPKELPETLTFAVLRVRKDGAQPVDYDANRFGVEVSAPVLDIDIY